VTIKASFHWIPALLVLTASALSYEMRFGGPRDATIKIDDSSLPWRATVNFVAVKCFDRGANLALNRSKADSYLLSALARRIGASSAQGMRVSGVRRTSETSTSSGNRFEATFEIPEIPEAQAKVASTSTSAGSTKAAKPSFNEPPADLLARKDDVANTIIVLSAILEQDFPAPPSTADEESTSAFAMKVADAEESIIARFKALRADLAKDNLLLSTERAELEQHADKVEKDLFGKLADRARQAPSLSN
jgi:hypothetical protein